MVGGVPRTGAPAPLGDPVFLFSCMLTQEKNNTTRKWLAELDGQECVPTDCRTFSCTLSLAGTASSVIFVATKHVF